MIGLSNSKYKNSNWLKRALQAGIFSGLNLVGYNANAQGTETGAEQKPTLNNISIEQLVEHIDQKDVDTFINERFLNDAYWIENPDSDNSKQGYEIRITSPNYGPEKGRYNAGQLQQTGDVMGILSSLEDILNENEKKDLIFKYLTGNLTDSSNAGKVEKNIIRIERSAVYYDGDPKLFHKGLVSESKSRKGRVQIFNNDVINGNINNSFTNLVFILPYEIAMRRYAFQAGDELLAKILEPIEKNSLDTLKAETTPDTSKTDSTVADTVVAEIKYKELRRTLGLSINGSKNEWGLEIIYGILFGKNIPPIEFGFGVNTVYSMKTDEYNGNPLGRNNRYAHQENEIKEYGLVPRLSFGVPFKWGFNIGLVQDLNRIRRNERVSEDIRNEDGSLYKAEDNYERESKKKLRTSGYFGLDIKLNKDWRIKGRIELGRDSPRYSAGLGREFNFYRRTK